MLNTEGALTTRPGGRTYVSRIKIAMLMHDRSTDCRTSNTHVKTGVCWDVTPCSLIHKSS